jgi:hypothetical protein
MESVKVSVPTPNTFTVVLPAFVKHGMQGPNGPPPLRTVVVSPVSVTVTRAFENGVESSVPDPVTVSVYVIGVARTGLTQPSRATVAATVSTSRFMRDSLADTGRVSADVQILCGSINR